MSTLLKKLSIVTITLLIAFSVSACEKKTTVEKIQDVVNPKGPMEKAGEKIDDILRLVAAPGCSEHHAGRALDIGSPAAQELDEQFAKTAEFYWLKKYAARFGFHLSYPRANRHRIGYEPWHWCWRP